MIFFANERFTVDRYAEAIENPQTLFGGKPVTEAAGEQNNPACLIPGGPMRPLFVGKHQPQPRQEKPN
jgi:hypothetical protein